MHGLNVVVCVKQVPRLEEAEIDFETGTLKRKGIECETNPFDLNALEEALRIREKLGGRVIALSMGPPQAEEVLRSSIAMGVDEAILLSDVALAGADTLATSYTLSCAMRRLGGHDLIICGEKTTDGDTGQVGPELAEHLGIPLVLCVQKIEKIDEGGLTVQRAVENGYQLVESPLPCLITVTKDINAPRLPTLRGKIEARKRIIAVWGVKELEEFGDRSRFGLEGSPTKVVNLSTPPQPKKGLKMEGSSSEQAAKLVSKLKDLGAL